jgi:hypothetical protein
MPETRGDHLQEIIHFFFRAISFIGILNLDIGSADQNAVKQREDQNDPSVLVLEEKFMIADCFAKLRMIEHKVRAFCPADEMRRESQAAIGKINPRAGGVNHQPRFNFVNGIRQFVAEKKRIAASATRLI